MEINLLKRQDIDQSAAKEKVSSLLTTRSYEELKKVELTTRAEIEDKREQLRSLIGERYHDIIDSATAIESMRKAMVALRHDIRLIQQDVTKGISSDEEQPYSVVGTSSSKVNQLESLNTQSMPILASIPTSQLEILFARRVKTIVDSPQILMSVLAEKRWIEATRLCLRIHRIFDQTRSFASHFSAHFASGSTPMKVPDFISMANPLLESQWKKFCDLQNDVIRQSNRYLSRTRLHHRVAQQDNLTNSKDVVQLLQSWKVELEKKKRFDKSSMLAAFEPSRMRPMAGISASLEHASHGFVAALSCNSMLGNSDPIKIFTDFLKCRKLAAKSVIDLLNPNNSTVDSIQQVLCEFVRTIQWTCYLVYNIFTTEESADEVQSTVSPTIGNQTLPLLNLTLSSVAALEFGLDFSNNSILSQSALSCISSPISVHTITTNCISWINECISLIPGASPFADSMSSYPLQKAAQSILAKVQTGHDLTKVEGFLAYQIEHPLERYSENAHDATLMVDYPISDPMWSASTTPRHGSGISTPNHLSRSGTSSSITSSSPASRGSLSRFFSMSTSLVGTPSSGIGGTSAASLLASARITKWKTITSRIFGISVNLWKLFFHNLFFHQAKLVIQNSFGQLSFDNRINACLQSFNRGHSTLTFGKPSLRPENDPIMIVKPHEANLGQFLWKTDADGWAVGDASEHLDRAHGLTFALKSLLIEFDSQISSTMADLRPMVVIEDQIVKSENEEADDPNTENPSLALKRRYIPSTKKLILQDLRKEIQENCLKFINQFSTNISDFVDKIDLSRSTDSSQASILEINIQRALFLGRLARALDTHSIELRNVLWQLEWSDPSSRKQAFSTLTKWTDRVSRQSLASFEHVQALVQTHAPNNSLNAQLVSLSKSASNAFDAAYNAAYGKWAVFSATELGSLLQQMLEDQSQLFRQRQDIGKYVSLLRHSWIVANLKADGTSQTTSTHLVPHQISSYLSKWLKRILEIIYQVGAHIVDTAILEFFVYLLSAEALDCYTSFVSRCQVSSSVMNRSRPQNQPNLIIPVTKDEMVQMWFDARVLFSLLSRRSLNSLYFQQQALKRSSYPSKNWDDVSDTLNWASKTERLMDEIKGKLDAIEVAFYAPHIAKFSNQFVSQSSTLYGMLMVPSERPGSASSSLLPDTSSANILPCVQNVSRFSTLPVSTPSLASVRETNNPMQTFSPNYDELVPESTVNPIMKVSDNTQDLNSKQAIEVAGAIWGKISAGVKGSWFS